MYAHVHGMGRVVKVKVPRWIREALVREHVRRLVEAEEARRRFIEEVIRRMGLTEEDVEDFERFREELWRREGKSYLS